MKHIMGQIPAGETRRVFGTAYHDGERWFANVGGNNLDARWLDPIQCIQGDKIVIDITNLGAGQYTALVLGGYTDQPRPSTGTILSVGIDSVIVTGEDGGVYTTTRFIGTAYGPGDPVYLAWDASIPTVLGVIAAVAPAPPQSAPPVSTTAPKPGSGIAKGTAVKTNTWWAPGGWGSYAGSTNGGEQVYSGTWSGNTVSGAWFYGSKFTGLGSKTVTRVRFWLPQRLNVGASGSATIHLYAHTSSAQPGGDVSRTVGPFNVVVAQGRPAGWVTLPIEFAAVLRAGGGISLAGEPYVGFNGRIRDPQSGRIEMDWTE